MALAKNNWNLGESKKNVGTPGIERAVLIALIQPPMTEEKSTEYLDELEFLAETAGAETVKRFVQKLQHRDSRTFIGSGKVKEIGEYIESHNIDLAIFDDDLTGKQTNILEEEWKIKIVDRTSLILDIFAARAQTAQARTQVELAQLQYLLPRLRGLWEHLERQRGGIGMRGPGEQEIETDRRIIRDKIALLKKKLEKIDQQNVTQRKGRGELIRVSLIGYTNVGKSTLMNILSKSDVFAENKLFATLDTTVRKVVLGTMPFLLSDTVGFIRKLPHHLVESFKSTLDEVREADILLHVVDIAHPQYEDHIHAVNQTLQEIKIEQKPTIMVLNKIDLYRERNYDAFLEDSIKVQIEEEIQDRIRNENGVDTIMISATTGENIPLLREMLKTKISDAYAVRYPYKTKEW
ncbi:MAG: GTPase HflX [Saprospiraceae bacterium]|uniref:GTPase HflX n=1 Tax=Candidatus Opimibacter skivensis TaxID=2982028 RepID=A0A9D7SSH0_9BACT|nr:GTPase HflX [Candidatus Opimibacter skivensis]